MSSVDQNRCHLCTVATFFKPINTFSQSSPSHFTMSSNITSHIARLSCIPSSFPSRRVVGLTPPPSRHTSPNLWFALAQASRSRRSAPPPLSSPALAQENNHASSLTSHSLPPPSSYDALLTLAQGSGSKSAEVSSAKVDPFHAELDAAQRNFRRLIAEANSLYNRSAVPAAALETTRKSFPDP